jgi:O-antigen/teichoic acid export membrane protein
VGTESLLKRQFFGLFLSRVAAAGIQAGTLILLARLLEVHALGVVGVVISVGAFTALATDFGVSTLTSRARARGEHALVRSGLRLNNLSSFGVAAIGCATVFLIEGWNTQGIALGLLFVALLFERNAETGLSLAFADGDARAPAVSIVGRRVVAVFTFVSLLLTGVEPLVSYCVGQLTGSAFGFLHKSWVERRKVRMDGEIVGTSTVLRHSWPFWVSAISGQARILDTAIVGGILGSYAAGIYSAAMKVVNPLNLIPVALASILLPHATRANSDSLGRMTRNVVFLFLSMYIPLGVLIYFSTDLIVLVIGEPYRESGPVLALAFAILPLIGLASPLTGILQARGWERFAAYNSSVFGAFVLIAIAIGAISAGPLGTVIAIGIMGLLRSISLLITIGVLRRRFAGDHQNRTAEG